MGRTILQIGVAILRQKYLWTILIFLAIVGFLDENSFIHRRELEAQNEELREEIRAFEESYARDTKELEALESDQDAVERVARVNLYMKTEDEDVYVLE